MYFSVCFVLGLLALPFLPESWLLPSSLGWTTAWVTEAWVHRQRVAALKPEFTSSQFAGVLVFGFLWKLGLLILGAVAGHVLELYSPRPFLGAFLLSLILGEAWSLPKVYKLAARK
jgi:hypothetical protein